MFCGEKEKKWKLLLSLLLFLQRTFFPEDKTYRQTILCVSLESFQSFLFSFWKIISAQKFYVEILPAYIPSPPLTTLCNCRHTKYIEKNKSFCTYRWRFENPSAWSARGINNQSIPHSLTRYTANGISTLSKHLSLSLYLHVIVWFPFIPLNNNNNRPVVFRSRWPPMALLSQVRGWNT